MKHLPLILAAAALAATAAIILASPINGSPKGAVPTLTYVPSKHLYIDYTAQVGLFLQGKEGLGKVFGGNHSSMYWVKGEVVNVAILKNASESGLGEGCGGGQSYYPIIFLLRVDDVIKGPEGLEGKTIRVYDIVTVYEDGKALFIYDHLPLIPGKTYVLGLVPNRDLTISVNDCRNLSKVTILNHTVYTASTLMRFLVAGDGHVIYLYDRDALYAADPDYADLMSKVSDPVVITYTGNDPHLTGKATYEEFRSWLLGEIGS